MLLTIKTIFFGANDSSLPDAPNKQHIPLNEYKDNLKRIITHPQIVAHNPHIILIAPPPINEHLWWPRDQSKGYTSVSRVASTTKEYADAVVQVGAELHVPVVNLWKAFMEKVNFKLDAWKAGLPLPGSLEIPQNDVLVELMYDGRTLRHLVNRTKANWLHRPPLAASRLQNRFRGGNEYNCPAVAGRDT